MLSMIVMTTLYSAQLYSYLQLSNQEKQIDTIDQFIIAIRTNTYRPLFVKNGNLRNMILQLDMKTGPFYWISHYLKRYFFWL